MAGMQFFYPETARYIETIILPGFEAIPSKRKANLQLLVDYVSRAISDGRHVDLVFICTHNSRRSHMAQVWAEAARAWYGIGGISAYSGGTEATAFHANAIAALQRAGFQIQDPGGNNPAYLVRFSDKHPPIVSFSKRFDDGSIPATGFVAVMVCSDAEEACPFVPGAGKRFSITFDDPKESDGTPLEAATYDARLRQIGTEMFYAFSLIKT
jgi:arsenate reductase (thioredoxin)